MQNEVDIFDSLGEVDFDSVETTMPVIAPGLYEFKITNMAREPWKSGKGSSLAITLSLESEATDITGEKVINPGFPLFDRISLVNKGKYDPRVPIKRFLQAVGMDDQPFDQSFQSYLGLTVQAKTKVTPERTDPDTGATYPARAEVSSYVKA
jgi:hypothetical protein